MATISPRQVRNVTIIVYFLIYFHFTACHISFHLEANWGKKKSRHCELHSRGSCSLELVLCHHLIKTQFSKKVFLKAFCKSFKTLKYLCRTKKSNKHSHFLLTRSRRFERVSLTFNLSIWKYVTMPWLRRQQFEIKEGFAILNLSLWEHSGKFQSGGTNWRQSYFLRLFVSFFLKFSFFGSSDKEWFVNVMIRLCSLENACRSYFFPQLYHVNLPRFLKTY